MMNSSNFLKAHHLCVVEQTGMAFARVVFGLQSARTNLSIHNRFLEEVFLFYLSCILVVLTLFSLVGSRFVTNTSITNATDAA